jgi:hypothetical protein
VKRRKLSSAQPRAALIASYGYGRSYWADVSKEERENSHTMEDGSYPINKCTGDGPSVESAVKAVGRGGSDHDEIRRHIIDAAEKEGCSEQIPDDWNSDGSIDEAKTGARLAATPPAPPAEKPAPDEKPEGPDLEADADVAKAIDAAIAAQEKDPDKSDPNDEKVLKLLQEAKAAQVTDTEDTAKKSGEPAEPSPKGAEKDAVSDGYAAGGPAVEGDADGEQKCANPDCGHLASAHEDGDKGKNTGPCSMENCECPAMQADAPSDLGKDELAIGQPGAPGAAPTEPVADTNLNAPPEVDGGENLGPAFSGKLVIEGQPTGDGRQIAADALTWRDPPLPLMLLATETHDPEGFDMNDPAVVAGRIETISREPGDGETQLINFTGHFLATEDGMYAAELTEQMGRLGVSADIAVQDREITVTEADEYGFPIDGTETLTEGTIMGGTACPFPAFEGCYIVLGDGTDLPTAKAIPQAAESPEVPDKPPAVVADGGQLIHWVTHEECSACDDGIEVIVASGAGPTRPPKAWFEDPCFTEGDGRLVEILGRNGRREDKYACPITITADGRVYGHLAPWGVCHTGKPGCVTAPPSAVNYAHFHHGYIQTAEGEKITVGALTADAPHAALGLSAVAAMAHYDNTATTVADVCAGPDEYGIWLAGAVRPDATEDQIRTATSRPPSGDWREIGGQLELVAALCVPVPGFPLAVVAHGQQVALVAYGAKVMEKLTPTPAEVEDPTDLLRIAAPALGRLARKDARERVAALG